MRTGKAEVLATRASVVLKLFFDIFSVVDLWLGYNAKK